MDPVRLSGSHHSAVDVLVRPLPENGKNLGNLKLRSVMAADFVEWHHAGSVLDNHNKCWLEGLTWFLNHAH